MTLSILIVVLLAGLLHVSWNFQVKRTADQYLSMTAVALVTAVRETSIIFALPLGVFFLKERLDLLKVFATLMTIFGVIVMRFAK